MKRLYLQKRQYLDILAGWLAVATAFFLPLSTSLADICFIAAPLIGLCAGNLQEKWRLVWERRAVFVFLILFLFFVLGVFYSSASSKQALSYLWKSDKLLIGVFFVPIFMNRTWASLAIHAFLLAILVTLVTALLKKVGIIHVSGFGELLVFKDRIQTSFALAIASYFCGVLFLNNRSVNFRWLYLILGLFSVFTLFAIDGRSGYFIFFVLLFLLLWEGWRWQGVVAYFLLSFIIIISAYTFSPIFKSRILAIGQDLQLYKKGDVDTSVGLRTSFLKHGLVIILEHPIFGTGTGSITTDYQQLNISHQEQTSNPHNEYVNISVQLGLVGLSILLLMFYLQWRDSTLLAKEMRYIARGVILTMAIGFLGNSWLMDSTEGHFYILFIALAFASQTSSRTLFSFQKNLR